MVDETSKGFAVLLTDKERAIGRTRRLGQEVESELISRSCSSGSGQQVWATIPADYPTSRLAQTET